MKKTNPNKPNLTPANWSRKVVISNGLYKTVNVRYDIRHISRCSSTVEHSFRKAGVEGPNPSIGYRCFALVTEVR